MKTLFREARFATLSLLCVLLGFLFFWAILESGIHIRLGNTMDKVAKFAALSLLCVLLGYLFFWAIVQSGIHIRLGNTMDKVAKFAALSPCLIAIVLALAGLRWDRRKLPGALALLASLASTFLIYALGG